MNQGEPETDFLEVQDWGTPWTRDYPADAASSHATLLAFASHFYFGE